MVKLEYQIKVYIYEKFNMRYLLIISTLFLSLAFSDLLKPYNQTLRTIHVLFEWEQEPEAVEYNIQASNSSSFNSSSLLIKSW